VWLATFAVHKDCWRTLQVSIHVLFWQSHADQVGSNHLCKFAGGFRGNPPPVVPGLLGAIATAGGWMAA
jgi:hypothetical protein